MTAPLLETRDLEKRFGGVRAVAGVSFSLAPGELRCLIGPNGAGKSTFFKMLTGQHRATAGRILLEGRDITRAEPHQIARLGVGIKNQVPDVFNGLSVRENLWLSARYLHPPARAAEAADEAIGRLGLAAAADRLVGELAHGQRQWVEIGMVIARAPKLILLDEPSAGMSDEETLRTAALIREINQTAALIVVEHDMQFIRRIAKQITVFHQGRILIEDTAEKVMRDPMVRDVYLGKQAA